MPRFRFCYETVSALAWASGLIQRGMRILLAMRFARLIAAAIVPCTVFQPAVAITINIEYSTDFTGEENPDWDEDGFILIGHFFAAKQIWESLLPGGGSYDIEFQWDDDIDPAGYTTIDFPDPDAYLIEMNPGRDWYADSDLANNDEFAFSQTLYPGLSAADQSAWFPGTAPPAALEVGYIGIPNGDPSPSLQPGVTSASGRDLLTIILHEMGHVLGIRGTEPGDYNIDPQHVGGVTDVLVKEADDDTILLESHLAGSGTAPWLMDSTQGTGKRVLPSATDVLVIAENQDISNVKLTRVNRISTGNWNNSSAWIGADVPDATQDVYVTHGGTVSLDVNASVKSLNVDGGSSVDVGSFQLTSAGDIRFDGGALSVGATGSISAEAFHGDPATLTTVPGSTIEFNNFTPGASAATAATFNGNVQIGIGTASSQVVFNPNAIATWNVGQNLTVGNPKPPTGSGSSERSTKLMIDNGVWNVGGNLEILKDSEVMVDGGFLDTMLNLTGGDMNVTGPVTVYGALTYRGRLASNTTYTIFGGSSIKTAIPPPVHLDGSLGASMTFENTTQGIAIGASIDTATINVGGGTGDGAPGAVVTFKGFSHADDGEFWNRSGIGGDSLRISSPLVIAGTGGRTTFEDNATAGTSHFRNDGVAEHGPHGSGGATHFRGNSSASSATFDNYGSTLQSYTGAVPAPGGRTEFFDTARASSGIFNNHPGQGMGALGAGVTIFRGNSTASSATFTNKGGVPGSQHGGSVEFYDTATASFATFYNEHAVGVSQHAGSAGNVRFYGSSTAGTATFHNQVGGGAVYFNDSSSAAEAKIFIEDTGTGTFGGHVVFNGNSKGGTSDITVRENAFSATVEFRGTSNAEDAVITLVNGHQSTLLVTNSASLGRATVDVGAGTNGNLLFRESATAANATISLRPGGGANFTGANTTAANATFTLDGAIVANGGTGSLGFTGANAGNATIHLNGGTALNAPGAIVSFTNGTNLGTVTVIGSGGAVPGAGGARVYTDASSNAANAKFTIGAGGDLTVGGFGEVVLGSLENAGSVTLGQTGLRIGGLNTLSFISGPITGFVNNGNAKVTKVGAGTLTLSGTNSYYGLTKVDGGTLIQNGTAPGPAEVNSGATLGGAGSFSGAVTVNNGGILAPGVSPGKMTVGSLTLNAGSSLLMEIGGTTPISGYDQVVTTGAMAMGGALQVSLINAFNPAAGQSFNLFDWGSLSGTFSSLSLPTLSGLTWNTSQLYTNGVLSVVAAALPGDFDFDGDVDGRDFLVWQRNTSVGDLVDWQTNYGVGTLTANSVAVPEPTSSMLWALLALTISQWALARGSVVPIELTIVERSKPKGNVS